MPVEPQASTPSDQRAEQQAPIPSGLRAITIVTGGSDGIGFELARCFAEAGHGVMLIARDSEQLQAAARKIAKEFLGEVSWLALDLTEPGADATINDTLAARGLYADVLVNNAGIGLSGEFVRHNSGQIEQLMQLNINAATRLMRFCLPGMLERKSGGILNVASLGGLAPGPYQAAYYASKAYLISLSEAVGTEVRSQGVTISVLAPGPVRTDFHQRMGSQRDFYYRFLPSLSATRVARAGYRGFKKRRRLIVPGMMNTFLAPALRILPNGLLMPIIAQLLKPRQQDAEDTGDTGDDTGTSKQ